jgi:hypothetical protein
VVLSTLICIARALCDEDSLQAELVFLRDVIKQNGYNNQQIHRALNHRPHVGQQENKPNSVAFLPFVQPVFNQISRMLAKCNIKSVALHHIKLFSLLHPVKGNLGLRNPGVCKIPCECGRVYIEQTGHSMDIRIKEHQRHTQLEHPRKSAMAEHSINQGLTN